MSAGAEADAWCLLVRPERALLALPIHLCSDQVIFGNFREPFGLSFEPATDPAYKKFVKNYEHIESSESSPCAVAAA